MWAREWPNEGKDDKGKQGQRQRELAQQLPREFARRFVVERQEHGQRERRERKTEEGEGRGMGETGRVGEIIPQWA